MDSFCQVYKHKRIIGEILSFFCPHVARHSHIFLSILQGAVIIIFGDSNCICGEISPTLEMTFSGSTSRSYGSCAGEVHAGSTARSGTSTTPTQLLETTPLVASCASEHSSASPISGDLPTARVPTSGSIIASPLNSFKNICLLFPSHCLMSLYFQIPYTPCCMLTFTDHISICLRVVSYNKHYYYLDIFHWVEFCQTHHFRNLDLLMI